MIWLIVPDPGQQTGQLHVLPLLDVLAHGHVCQLLVFMFYGYRSRTPASSSSGVARSGTTRVPEVVRGLVHYVGVQPEAGTANVDGRR